jgi:SOS-response transcriptional repressor LexA
MEPIDRIAELLRARHLSWAEFARRIGTTDQRLYNWRKRGLPAEEVLKVAEAFGVSTDWLLTGKEPQPAGPPQLISVAPSARRIPVVDYVQAGGFRDVIDAYAMGNGFDEIFVDAGLAGRLSPYAFALQVEGDSMRPDYAPGDIVVVNPDLSPRPGDVVVAKLDREGSATLKRFRDRGVDASGQRVIELVPFNDDYPVLVMDTGNPGRIIGVVVELRKRLR